MACMDRDDVGGLPEQDRDVGRLGGEFYNDIQALDPVGAGWITLDTQSDCPGNTSFLPPNGSDENDVVWDSISNLLWIYNGGSGYRCGESAECQPYGRRRNDVHLDRRSDVDSHD